MRESIEANMIKPLDAKAAPKLMKYIPFWAAQTTVWPNLVDKLRWREAIFALTACYKYIILVDG